MTEPPPIVEFITARYAEDEAVARAATKGPWTDGGGNPANGDGYGFGEIWILPPDDNEYEPDEATATHIARWDPVAVLADIAAKRAIVAKCLEQLANPHGAPIGRYLARDTLKLLADPYAGHPDFRADWRVTE